MQLAQLHSLLVNGQAMLDAMGLGNLNTDLIMLGFGGTVAVTLQLIKKLGKIDEFKGLIAFLLSALSMAASTLQSFMQYASLNPQIAEHLGWIMIFAMTLHRIFVSPGYNKAVSWLNQLQDAMNAHQQEKAALQPATAASAGAVSAPASAETQPPTFTLQ